MIAKFFIAGKVKTITHHTSKSGAAYSLITVLCGENKYQVCLFNQAAAEASHIEEGEYVSIDGQLDSEERVSAAGGKYITPKLKAFRMSHIDGCRSESKPSYRSQQPISVAEEIPF